MQNRSVYCIAKWLMRVNVMYSFYWGQACISAAVAWRFLCCLHCVMFCCSGFYTLHLFTFYEPLDLTRSMLWTGKCVFEQNDKCKIATDRRLCSSGCVK